jgi:SAM-dependent methyltransferase
MDTSMTFTEATGGAAPPAEITTCLLGCDRQLEPMARWAPYRVCAACGSGFFAPPPRDEYWSSGTAPSAEQHQRWSERSRQWAPVVGAHPGRVLDVGCGFGHFVRWAEDRGWDAWGYEPDGWARGQSVCSPQRVRSDLEALPSDFDLVTMWDVLEHDADPVGLARSLQSRLRPGGRIAVCSPNFEALQRRWWWLRRSPDRFMAYVRPHEHVTQFTPDGLAVALARAGYHDVTREHPPLSRRAFVGADALVRRFTWLRSGLFVTARHER